MASREKSKRHLEATISIRWYGTQKHNWFESTADKCEPSFDFRPRGTILWGYKHEERSNANYWFLGSSREPNQDHWCKISGQQWNTAASQNLWQLSPVILLTTPLSDFKFIVTETRKCLLLQVRSASPPLRRCPRYPRRGRFVTAPGLETAWRSYPLRIILSGRNYALKWCSVRRIKSKEVKMSRSWIEFHFLGVIPRMLKVRLLVGTARCPYMSVCSSTWDRLRTVRVSIRLTRYVSWTQIVYLT